MSIFESDFMPRIKKITARIVDRINEKNPRSRFESRFAGCTQTEIEELMAIQGVTFLPPLFQDFLLHAGKANGGVISFNVYSEIKHFKRHLIDTLLHEGLSISVPPDAFVFSSDTVRYLFFHTQSREIDPPVYRYCETGRDFRRRTDSLSEWFRREIDDYERLYRMEYPE